MSGSRYPLRVLLELRRREREVREAELKRRSAAHGTARERVRQIDQRLAGMAVEGGGRPGSGSLAQDWHRYGQMLTLTLEERQLRLADEARAAADLAASRADFAGAKAREEALERHRDRFLGARAAEERKRVEREADEVASRRAAGGDRRCG